MWMGILVSLSTAVAFADTWAPFEGGFVSPERDDAPTDAVLVYAANYLPQSTVISGPGAPFPLESSLITGEGGLPRIALHPPDGGWIAGERYVLSVLGYDNEREVASFEFTAGTAAAPDPGPPVIDGVTAESWSGETNYPWGCCHPIRHVDVAVAVPDADPWARVEIVGRFNLGQPSQVTTQEIHTHLDVGMGAGPHALRFLQWEDDRGPQPPCFDVVSVSAAGVVGPSESRCTEDLVGADTEGTDPAVREPAGQGCGCASSSPAALSWLALPWLWLARKQRKPKAG